MIERIQILEKIFDKKTVRIVKELLDNPTIFYLRDISKKTKVSLATTYRIIQKLADANLVEKQKIGKFIQYKVKKGNTYEELFALINGKDIDPISLFKSKIKEKYNANFKIYNTKDGKIFLISNSIDKITEIIQSIEEETQTKLNILKVTEEQFKQMRMMSLIKEGKYL